MKKRLLLMAILLLLTFDSWGKDSDEPMTREEHEYVDLGLPSGTLWATCNVGANSPEEYGDYFAWGETEPKEIYHYQSGNYKWCNGTGNTNGITKYVGNTGSRDGKTELDPEDDAAYVNWGQSWRIPTKAQLEELLEQCTWTWTSQNGVEGYSVSGPSGAEIFLPAAGYRWRETLWIGSYGLYWSRTIDSHCPYYVYNLYFISDRLFLRGNWRFEGLPVRPVRVSQN